MTTARFTTRTPGARTGRARAATFAATLLAVVAASLTFATPASAFESPLPDDPNGEYLFETVPASIEMDRNSELPYAYPTSIDWYEANTEASITGTGGVYNEPAYFEFALDADGRKLGYWRATYEDNRGIGGEFGEIRNVGWSYQPFGVHCPTRLAKIAEDPYTGTLSCLADEAQLRAEYGDTWYDTRYAEDSAACAQYGKYAVIRQDTTEPFGCAHPSPVHSWLPGQSKYIEDSYCGPSERTDVDGWGTPMCMYEIYDWMTPEMLPAPTTVTVTRTVAVEATETVTATTADAQRVTVKRGTVSKTYSQRFRGRLYSATRSAPVKVSASALVAGTGTATRSASASANGTCTRVSALDARKCATRKAKEKATGAATETASAAASAAARDAALADSVAWSVRAAAKTAETKTVPSGAVTKARRLAKQRAVAAVAAKIDAVRG